MRLRIASINDLPIKDSERKYHWPLGRRPDEHPSLSALGLSVGEPEDAVPGRPDRKNACGKSSCLQLKQNSTLSIRHPEVRAKRASKDERPGLLRGRGPSPFEARSLRSLAPQGDGVGVVLGSTTTPSNMETRCRGAMRPEFAKCLPRCSPFARGAERRKALVRNAAPMAALRLGQSLQRKGLPAHDADRRALRRSTTVFAKPWPHSLSGRAFLPGLLTCSPGSPAGSLRTGHLGVQSRSVVESV